MSIARKLGHVNPVGKPRNSTVKLPGMNLDAPTPFLQNLDRIRMAIAAREAAKGEVFLPSRPAVLAWLAKHVSALAEKDALPLDWGRPSKMSERRAK